MADVPGRSSPTAGAMAKIRNVTTTSAPPRSDCRPRRGRRVLASFDGPSGRIKIVEDLASGMRHYEEGGVSQSCVLPGGDAGIEYVCLMATLLEGGGALLLGCGGGSLAAMLHRRGAAVTVVDVNALSFVLARTFFWMPIGVTCITADVRRYMLRQGRKFEAIGIDLGGPHFSYEEVLDTATVVHTCRALRSGGRIATNVSCETREDPMPGRIAAKFKRQGLDTWVFIENTPGAEEVNAVVLASARREKPAALATIAAGKWSLARLGA
jgi:SAM-dependent methyltransferase